MSRLAWALAGSSLVHLCVALALAPDRAPSAALAPPLRAPVRVSILAREGSGVAAPAIATPRRRRSRAEPRGERGPVVPGTTQVLAAAASERGAQPVGEGVAARVGPSEALAGSGPAHAGAGGGAEASSLSRRLAESARRCYPAPARRYGLTGSVEVAFCVGQGGALTSLEAKGSTGSSLLDRAASECVVQGALPLSPAGCYLVPVRFERE